MAQEPEPARKTRWSGVLLGVALSCFAAYQQFKLPPVLPDLLREFPHDRTIAAGFMSVYALIGLVVSQPLGHWLQRGDAGAGRKRGILLAGALSALGCAIALAWPASSALFLFGRGLEGFAFAICAIAGPAMAARAAAPRDLAFVTGLLAGWIPIGQIGGALAAWAVPDWRFPWALGLALALALCLFGRFATPAPGEGPPPTQVLTRHQTRLLWLGGAVFTLWSAQYFAFMTWLTSYLELGHGLSLRGSVGAYLLPVVVLLGFNVLTGWALGRGLKLLPALILALVSQALVWIAAPFADGWVGIALLVLYGIGAGVAPTCLFQVPHRIVGGTARAGAFGIVMAARNVGVFCGPLILGLLIATPQDWPLGFHIFAAIALGAAALAALLRFLIGPAPRAVQR